MVPMPNAFDALRAAMATSRSKPPVRPSGWVLVILGLVIAVGGLVVTVVAHVPGAIAAIVIGATVITGGLSRGRTPRGR